MGGMDEARTARSMTRPECDRGDHAACSGEGRTLHELGRPGASRRCGCGCHGTADSRGASARNHEGTQLMSEQPKKQRRARVRCTYCGRRHYLRPAFAGYEENALCATCDRERNDGEGAR
jgi:hypothetical protein